ncbi:MAG: patatin-like phospholipase family protein [Actinomycetota bacterium]
MGSNGSKQPSRAQWLRRLALRRRDRIAFVLSGGGPLGAMHVGALRALLEHGVYPELLVGTSVGALNATFIAFDPSQHAVDKLEEIWRDLDDGDLFPGGRFKASWARMLVRGNRVFESTGMRKLIETRLPDAQFEDAAVPLSVVATDLETGAEEIFNSGPILDPLLASTAMPGVFPPVTIGDRLYIDGGVANNVPIAPAVALGAKTVYVMDSTSHSHQRRPLNRPIDYLLHAFTLARAQRLAIEQTTLAEKVRLVVLPPAPLDFFVPFASMEYSERLIDIGYESAKAFLTGGMPTQIEEVAGGAVEVIAPAK